MKRQGNYYYSEMIIIPREEINLFMRKVKYYDLSYAIEHCLHKQGVFINKDMFNYKEFKKSVHVYIL